MVLKIHGGPSSTCTNRVRVVAGEIGVPLELVVVDFANGEHKTPAFVQHKPFGQMPYLDDDGFIVYESRAIAHYLVLKYGVGKVIPDPKDVQKYALFEQAASVELSNFNPSAAGLAYENIFKVVFDGGKTDVARVEQLTSTLEKKLAAYEVIFGKHKYLAGDELTIADLFHLPYGALLAKQGIDFFESGDKFPNINRWWKDISSRASWKKLTQ